MAVIRDLLAEARSAWRGQDAVAAEGASAAHTRPSTAGGGLPATDEAWTAYLYPDLDTWTVFPWGDENGSVAGLICDVYTTEGLPFQGDPRSNLKRALKHMEELGFKSFNLGPEPEFFLFKLDENGEPTLEVNDKGGYFDLAPTDLADNTRREIVNV